MTRVKYTIATIIVSFISTHTFSNEFVVGAGENFSAVRSVYDGDGVNISFRLSGIDTPEIKGKCDKEIKLAIKARDFSRRFYKNSEEIRVKVNGVGRYGRPLVDIYSNQGHLNQLLLDNDLAVIYNPKKRMAWCN